MAYRALSSALVLILAIGATGPVDAAHHKARQKVRERAHHARVVRYWTPQRMARAVPREFVSTKRGFRLSSSLPTASVTSSSTAVASGTTRATRSDGGTPEPVVTGAPWVSGGPVALGVGTVYFTMGIYDYQCSGAVVDDLGRPGYSLVLTAGHCAFDEESGLFATNWLFVPAYDSQPGLTCATTAYGCWSATALVVHAQYGAEGYFGDLAAKHDWAFAVVSTGGKSSTQLDQTVPAFPISFGNRVRRLFALGYPADVPYDGTDLTYCLGSPVLDSDLRNATWGLVCDMTPGASGGPWFRSRLRQTTAPQVVNSLSSYRYLDGPMTDRLFGPRFTSQTRAVYDAARTTTSNRIVH
jgi:hypothetical protein